MEKKLLQLSVLLCSLILVVSCQTEEKKIKKQEKLVGVKKKKTLEDRRLATEARLQHDLDMQKDPLTGIVPDGAKKKELANALLALQNASRTNRNTSSFISRGPSNLGGRTRAFAQDLSDATGNTLLAGGVSGGMFRSTDGGASWIKVSPNDEIHNVTTIAQDPRSGHQNVWYYGTGEWSGNSASLGSSYRGYGIWKSTNGGVTWSQVPFTVAGTAYENFDRATDYIMDMEVHPTTGELFVAATGVIIRMTETDMFDELAVPGNEVGWTDLEITSTGRVYAAIQGNLGNGGVWTSATGTGGWTNIANNGAPANWAASGRITLAVAPSNDNIVYALYNNGKSNAGNDGNLEPSEADLWQYNAANTTWTNYTSKLPDEDGPTTNSSGNDPFSIQGGYDLVISVKPDNANFLVIGGTNAYKINDIANDAMFSRIGGYASNNGYGLYSQGGVVHHPDIHSLFFDKNDPNVLYTGTDGGLHKTNNITGNVISWINLNNNYQTYQYYHVNMSNVAGDDFILGGAQDNGTTTGGKSASFINAGDPTDPDNLIITDLTTMRSWFGGDGCAVAVDNLGGGAYTVYGSSQNGRMLRGARGFAGADITPSGVNSRFVTYFYMDPQNVKTIYYAGNAKVLRTNNAETVTSATWDDLGSLPIGELITTYEASPGTYDPATSYLIIGGIAGNLYRLPDPKNATDLSNAVKISPTGLATPNPDGSGGQYTSDIAIHPTNPDIAIVTYANYNVTNIFITTNLTAATPTWTEVERNLNIHSIRSAAITVKDGNVRYYVGTARGLYSSADPTTEDWVLEGPDTIGLAVVSGLVYRPADNKLLVGTHGNGMFETIVGVLSTDEFAKDDVNLTMYPNPTQFELRFTSNQIELSNKTEYVISDTSGRTVARGNLKDKAINVSRLSKGMYIVRLSENGVSTSRKFIKN